MPFKIESKEFAGIISDVPDGEYIFNDNFDFHFEQGRLRWFRWCGKEFIRMLHVAVRDENWMTVPMNVTDLLMRSSGEKLKITFSALYNSATIQFRAFIEIEADETGLTLTLSGVAENDFLRNRIGICLLLPVDPCRNQACTVIHPNENIEHGFFPSTISPHQPFKDIRALNWHTEDGVGVESIFQGEIFEMEDQRNWSDHSFKIYGTPLHIPFPQMVKRGEKFNQSVSLKFSFPVQKIQTPELFLLKKSELSAMPVLGLQYTGSIGLLTEKSYLLRQLKLHHLRIDVVFDEDWDHKLVNALALAVEVGATIELVLVVKENIVPAERLLQLLNSSDAILYSILILTNGQQVTNKAGLTELIKKLKSHFRNVLIGTGTALHFAEINRSFESAAGADFAAFPVNPQVHADDSLTIIENLQAFPEIIHTASIQFGDLNWHISRLTLRYPFNPDNSGANRYDSKDGKRWIEDLRQHSLFCAAWTALSLHYLSKTSSITFFDDFGPGGVMYDFFNGNDFQSKFAISPSYLILGEIGLFEPVKLSGFTSSSPLTADGVCFFNSKGQQLVIFVNWSSQPVTFETDVFDSFQKVSCKTLNNKNLEEKLHLPLEWIGEQYVEFEKPQFIPFIVQKGEVCFVLASSGHS